MKKGIYKIKQYEVNKLKNSNLTTCLFFQYSNILYDTTKYMYYVI